MSRRGISILLAAIASATVCIAAGSSQTVPDPIVGVWKLHAEKSESKKKSKSKVRADFEVIRIVAVDDKFKLTFEGQQGKKHPWKAEIVTNMDGTLVKYNDGSFEESGYASRITRQNANRFRIESMAPFGKSTDDYDVSADGRVMTLERVDSTGEKETRSRFTYDRVT
jgi:hypothetical protein